MNDLPLFDLSPVTPRFDGADYRPSRDDARLTSQLQDIKALMADGQWRTLGDIERRTGHPQASISAQIRHLKKPRFGSHVVNKRYDGSGLYSYQVIVAKGDS